MTASAGFIVLLQELLAPIGSISIRRMFGGAGVYADGMMFAILDGDTLYFKTDAAGSAVFATEGMGPFTYTTKTGEGALKSYWRAPERLLDDPDEMVEWARRALVAAQANPSKRANAARQREASPRRRPAK